MELRWLPPVEKVQIQDGYLAFVLAQPDHVFDGAASFDSSSASAQAAIRNIESRQRADMLAQFVELYDSPDRNLLAYAKVWGRLRLCRHKVPYQHGRLVGTPEALLKRPSNDPNFLKQRQLNSRSGSINSVCMPLLREPIETWRFFSKQANAMLNIAANLNLGMPGDDCDWDCVLASGLPPYNPSIARPAELKLHRNYLLTSLRAWMSMSRFHPWIVNLEGKIHLGEADLFGKLSLELALAISRIKAPAVCSACGGQYDAVRRPSEGRSHYCSDPRCQRESARRRKIRSRLARRKL
jgi:hypothetical protein